jgi:hypothetical protein
MKIGEDYKIEGDSICLILYKRRVVQKGKNKGDVWWDAINFFNPGRYDHALEKLVEMEVSGLEDLESIAKMLDSFKEWIREALKTLPAAS